MTKLMERKDLAKIYYSTLGRGISMQREFSSRPSLKELEHGEHYVHEHPMFISQLASADPKLIDGAYGSIHDVEAQKRFGAKDLSEFSYWSWRSCAITALEMVLKTEGAVDQTTRTMDLVNEGLSIDGYEFANDVGWFHTAIQSIAKAHGMESSIGKLMPPSQIAKQIANGNYVIASVKSETGGHLVLLYGFRLNEDHKVDGFYAHDPSDYSREGEGVFISKSDFLKIYKQRIITIHKKQ